MKHVYVIGALISHLAQYDAWKAREWAAGSVWLVVFAVCCVAYENALRAEVVRSLTTGAAHE